MTSTDSPFRSITRRIDSSAEYVRHWPLVGGVSAQIDAIEFVLPGGAQQQVVVRRHGAARWKTLEDDVTATEFALQAALFEAGFPVPEPLLLDVSGSVLPSPYLVMEMVEGTTVVDEEHLANALQQMAELLLRLHSLDVDALGVSQLPQGDDPVLGALQYIPNEPSYANLRDAVTRWVPKPVAGTLLHGDFWPGNILWRDHKIAAVIDWEDAAIGSPLSDLAGCRSEIMAMYGEPAMEGFSRHYLAVTPCELSDLPLWEVYAGCAALASMADWGLDAKTEALRRQRTTQFVERAARQIVDHA